MTLPYPPNAIGWEVAFTVALLVFELARLALGASLGLGARVGDFVLTEVAMQQREAT